LIIRFLQKNEIAKNPRYW